MGLALAGIAIGASLGGSFLASKQRKAEIRRLKRQKARNDLVAQTRFNNAVQRKRSAEAGFVGASLAAQQEVEIATQRAIGTAKVMSAVTGITGISIDNTLIDIKRQQGKELVSIDKQIDDYVADMDRQMQANLEGLQDTLAGGQVHDMSSDFSDAVNLLTTGLQAYSSTINV